MSKNLNVAVLLDFYGNMLTDKQRDAIDLYYNQDLSLSEIAEHQEITRQGVRDSIKRGEVYLFELEDKLHLFDAEGLFPYTSKPHTSILVNLFKQEQPQICLMGATVIGRDLGPRVSSALTSGLTADCTLWLPLSIRNTVRKWQPFVAV